MSCLFATRLLLTFRQADKKVVIYNLDTQSIEKKYSPANDSRFFSTIISSKTPGDYFCLWFDKQFDGSCDDEIFAFNMEGNLLGKMNVQELWNKEFLLNDDTLEICGQKIYAGRYERATVDLRTISNYTIPKFSPYSPMMREKNTIQKESTIYQTKNGYKIYSKGRNICCKLKNKSPKIIYADDGDFTLAHLADNSKYGCEFPITLYLLRENSFFSYIINDHPIDGPVLVKHKKIDNSLFYPSNNIYILHDGRFIIPAAPDQLIVIAANLSSQYTFRMIENAHVEDILVLRSLRSDNEVCHKFLAPHIPIKPVATIVVEYLEF